MSANKLADKILLDSYKQLRLNIAQTPANKNKLITEFADNIENYTKNSLLVTNESDNQQELKKMLKKLLVNQNQNQVSIALIYSRTAF